MRNDTETFTALRCYWKLPHPIITTILISILISITMTITTTFIITHLNDSLQLLPTPSPSISRLQY